MKKLYSLTLATCALVNLCSAAVDTDKLEEAIEQSELGRVKALLNKAERSEMTSPARKKMLMNLYDSATEVVERHTSSLSLIGNWRDVAKTISGALLTTVSGMALFVAAAKRRAGFLAGGIFFGAVGLPLLYKGITCTTQQGKIAQAKTVEKFLEGRLSDVEAEPAN